MADIFQAFECDETFNTDAPKPKPNNRGRLLTATDATRYALAGKSTITLVSVKTEKRFTYRISIAKNGTDTFFVGVLTGENNETDYSYLGRISRGLFWQGRKATRPGDISADAPSAKAFAWAWKALCRGTMPESLEVWHESFCGRCGHKLTVPSSVSQGFGPECIGKIGF